MYGTVFNYIDASRDFYYGGVSSGNTSPCINYIKLTDVQSKSRMTQTITAGSTAYYPSGAAVYSFVNNSLPTKVSDLQNDLNFIDNTVNNLTNYYTTSNTYTKSEVDSLIDAISTLNIEIVQTLPATGSTSTIYLVPKTASTNDNYDEYIYVSNSWEHIGSTEVDLSNYYTKTETDNKYALKSLYSDTTINVGRKANTTVGNYSTAEGYNTTANGQYAHAEGASTTASGKYSHAEGFHTSASKETAHAEGSYTTADGNYSHAEGYNTTANGQYAHTEGAYTTATGSNSHVEGYNTKASSNYQHVSGKYNIEDSSNTYAEIIGNGSANNARSNARTLDWGGNEVLAGKLTVGTGPTNNLDVATKKYVDDAISGGGGGTATDVKINGTSITSNDEADIQTYGTYNASTNKIATMSDLPTVPTKTSDLTNDSDFIDGLVILSYGSSTWNDFLTAYQKNKVVYCRASSNSNPASGSQTRLAFMAYVNNATSPTEVEFQYYRSVSSHSDSQQGDQVFVYKLTSSGTWTVTTRNAFSKVVAGTGLSSSYSNGAITLTANAQTETDPIFVASAAHGITSTDISNWNSKSDFSGNYNDLTNKPTIPTATSDLTNDSGYITSSALSGYATTTALDDVQDQVDANSDNIISNSNKIGTLANLTTNTKTDLVSAINEVNKKDIITVYVTSTYTASSAADYIPNSLTINSQLGNKLSVSGGDVVIGSGVSKILVSGTAVLSLTGSGSKIRNFSIRKNNTNQKTASENFNHTGWAKISITSVLIDVEEGDTIKIQSYLQSGDKLNGGSAYTYITLEVVEYS